MVRELRTFHNLFLSAGIAKGIVKNRLGRWPYKLNFAVTNRCNSRCLTCQIWRQWKFEDELRLEEIGAVFRKYSHFVWLSLTGGEPFLRGDLPEIIGTAVESLPNLQFVSIPSNGLDTPRVLAALERILVWRRRPTIYLTFSLDGPPEIHDEIRGIKGAFTRTWSTYEGVQRLVAKDPKFSVGLETTLSIYNQDYAEDFLKGLISAGHDVFVSLAHRASFYGNEEGEVLVPDFGKVASVLRFLEDHFDRFKPDDILKRAYLRGARRYLNNPQEVVWPCSALSGTVSLLASGDVVPCLMWGKVLGNLRDFDYDLGKILSTTLAQQTQQQVRQGRCPLCWTPCEAIQTIIDNFPRSLR